MNKENISLKNRQNLMEKINKCLLSNDEVMMKKLLGEFKEIITNERTFGLIFDKYESNIKNVKSILDT